MTTIGRCTRCRGSVTIVHDVKVEAYRGDRDAQTARLCETNGCLDKVRERAIVTPTTPEPEPSLVLMY